MIDSVVWAQHINVTDRPTATSPQQVTYTGQQTKLLKTGIRLLSNIIYSYRLHKYCNSFFMGYCHFQFKTQRSAELQAILRQRKRMSDGSLELHSLPSQHGSHFC